MSESDDGGGFLAPRAYEQLRITSAPRLIQVISGPHVVPTRRGYQPVLCVEELHEGKKYLLYISAVSLTDALESIDCEGRFTSRRGVHGSQSGRRQDVAV